MTSVLNNVGRYKIYEMKCTLVLKYHCVNHISLVHNFATKQLMLFLSAYYENNHYGGFCLHGKGPHYYIFLTPNTTLILATYMHTEKKIKIIAVCNFFTIFKAEGIYLKLICVSYSTWAL